MYTPKYWDQIFLFDYQHIMYVVHQGDVMYAPIVVVSANFESFQLTLLRVVPTLLLLVKENTATAKLCLKREQKTFFFFFCISWYEINFYTIMIEKLKYRQFSSSVLLKNNKSKIAHSQYSNSNSSNQVINSNSSPLNAKKKKKKHHLWIKLKTLYW